MQLFTRHPHSVGETYWQHLCFAIKFGVYMLLGSITAFIHAIFPFLFEKTTSGILCKLMDEFAQGKRAELLEKHSASSKQKKEK